MPEYLACGLDTGHSIHELWQESAPDLTGGPADYHDVLNGLCLSVTIHTFLT